MKAPALFTLLFIFLLTKGFSQQCAYDKYYLFALQVKTMGSKVNVPNLKMYLVDEQDKPRIYHTQTGKLHQEILIPRISPSQDKENNYTVKFIDFYNRGITEAKDFSEQIESWRDEEVKGFRQKLNYYIFNNGTQLYELDTTLSNYNDVFYDETLKVFRRYNFKVTPKSRITYTLQLENNKWVLIDSNEAFFELPPPNIKPPSSNCMVVNGNEHILPLKAMNNTTNKLSVVDTFWLYNNCEDTLFINKKESSTKEFFGTPQMFLPKQRTAIVFNGQLTNDTYNFHYHRFFCALTLTDGSIIGLSIIVPAVNKNVKVFYRADSSIQYAVSVLPQTWFSIAVFTYPSGQIRAFGTVLNKDTSLKFGNWNYFKEGSLNSEGIQYSKSITLSAFDDVNFKEHNKFKVKILDNGIWFEPIADYINHQVKFYISPQTDSIIAFTDSTSYAFAVSYKKLPLYFTKQFFLLKANERTLKIGHDEMPFGTKEHQYALLLNYDRFKSKNKTTFQLTDSIIALLQSQYPKISTVRISSNQRGISLENLEQKEREKVIRQLTKDSSIAFICQLYYTNRNQEKLFYCDNKVKAEIDIDAEYPEKFRRKALKLGYSNIDTDAGGNRFWLSYPSKLIDESFFESFHRLTNEKLVIGAYFNTYVEPDLDDQ